MKNTEVLWATIIGFILSGCSNSGVAEPQSTLSDTKLTSSSDLNPSSDSQGKYRDTSGIFKDDRDGHEYRWIKIGSQIWMAENLAYLPSISELDDYTYTSPRYYVPLREHENSVVANSVNYNWLAARSACPPGWHLPQTGHWDELSRFVGGDSVASIVLKAKSSLWFTDNGTDIFGFSAFPLSGIAFERGSVSPISSGAAWWTLTEKGINTAYFYGLSDNHLYHGYHFSSTALPIRCLLDR